MERQKPLMRRAGSELSDRMQLLTIRRRQLRQGRAKPRYEQPIQVEAHTVLEVFSRPGLTGAELARELSIDKSTASRTIAKLTERGYVNTELSPTDSRRVEVRVTGKGADWCKATLELESEVLAVATKGLLSRDIKAVTKLLNRVCDSGGVAPLRPGSVRTDRQPDRGHDHRREG